MGGVSAAVSKTAAAPIERVKLLIQNQVCLPAIRVTYSPAHPSMSPWKNLLIKGVSAFDTLRLPRGRRGKRPYTYIHTG
jgi:hypothetical protein